jgi:membrane protease YdiL (CAAX protease family)
VPVKVGILCCFIVWARRFAGLTWTELGLGRAEVGAGLRLGGWIALVIAAAIMLLVVVPATRSFFEDNAVAADSVTHRVLMPFVIIPVGTALFEEIIFRGVLLGVLLRVSTARTAIVASSVLFGLWHLPPALHDASGDGALKAIGIVVGTIAVTTGAGLLFAHLRLRSGSLAAPVLAHAATNSFAYIGALVSLRH